MKELGTILSRGRFRSTTGGFEAVLRLFHETPASLSVASNRSIPAAAGAILADVWFR